MFSVSALAKFALVAAALPSAFAFQAALPLSGRRAHAVSLRAPRMASETVGNVNEIPPGERKITKVGDDDVMVVNHKGTVYALSPKCPHLGLPMKTGEVSDDGPCITCKFHGSKFKLDNGECVEWSESVFGIPGTQVFGNMIGKVGGAPNSPATVYAVSVDEDGSIVVDTGATGSSGASGETGSA